MTEQEKFHQKIVFNTCHFECEAYREVLFRSTSQKTAKLPLFNNFTQWVNL
jgi:hypothetical protein